MSTEGDARWMCQWGTQRDPGLAEAALGAQVYDLGQEALNLGLLGQDACPLPGDPPPAVFSGLPVRAGQAGPPMSRDHALAHV